MKPRTIMAEQNDGNEELWNSPKDRWSRKAKHPLQGSSRANFDESWEKGDIAIYENTEVEISIPRGPNSTIGILLNGETRMVRESMLRRIDEGVLGAMQPLSPINRMMQLAGLSVPTVIDPTQPNASIEAKFHLNETDATNMFDGLFKANVSGEFKNNPPAARLATIGQILVSLNSQISEIGDEIDTGTRSRLDVVPGIGAKMIDSARKMLNPQNKE